MQGGFPDERRARIDLVEVAREIYQRKLAAAADGNLSVRVASNRIVTTPSGAHKGRLKPKDLVVVDLDGQVLGAGASIE